MAEEKSWWDDISDVLLYPARTVQGAVDTVDGAIKTVEIVLLLLAVAVILVVIYNPGALKSVAKVAA